MSVKVLDQFSGTGSISKHCLSHPETCAEPAVSLEIVKKCKATITNDIMELDDKALWQPGDFDIVWASPPVRGTMHALLAIDSEDDGEHAQRHRRV